MKARRQDRRKRVPFGISRQKLNLDAAIDARLKKAELRPRWINDDESGRIAGAMEGGYDFVEADKDTVVGDEQQEKDLRIRKVVGKTREGKPQYAYLMAIKEEYYQEDQALKEAENAKVDEAIRGGKPQGVKDHGIPAEHGGTYVKNISYTP